MFVAFFSLSLFIPSWNNATARTHTHTRTRAHTFIQYGLVSIALICHLCIFMLLANMLVLFKLFNRIQRRIWSVHICLSKAHLVLMMMIHTNDNISMANKSDFWPSSGLNSRWMRFNFLVFMKTDVLLLLFFFSKSHFVFFFSCFVGGTQLKLIWKSATEKEDVHDEVKYVCKSSWHAV